MRSLREKGLSAFEAYTRLLLQGADLRPGLAVLDLACGAGEPALEEARKVGPTGLVTGVDPLEAAVTLARERAKASGLIQARFDVGGAESLCYPDRSFDRVTSRFGAMYFTDLSKAIAESRRVLRPGGRVAWLVWGSIDRPLWRSTVFVALKRAGLARIPPKALEPFCFSNGGVLSRALSDGGFEAVSEVRNEVPVTWPGPPEEVCTLFLAGMPHFETILDAIPPGSRRMAEDEILESLRGYWTSGQVVIPTEVILATGMQGG